MRSPRLVVFAAVAAAILIGCFRDAHPEESVEPLLPPPAPKHSPHPVPWHAALRPCEPPSSVDGSTWVKVTDVDGDGLDDFLETTCSDQPSPAKCAFRLCIGTVTGPPLIGAAWVGDGPQLVSALPPPSGQEAHSGPRDFEAFVVTPDLEATGPRCVRARRFTWRGDGYLGTGEWRCGCEDPQRPPGLMRRQPCAGI